MLSFGFFKIPPHTNLIFSMAEETFCELSVATGRKSCHAFPLRHFTIPPSLPPLSTHLLIVDLYHPVPVRVQFLETLGQRPQHDTTLDKVIKLHRPSIIAVKDPSAKGAEIH